MTDRARIHSIVQRGVTTEIKAVMRRHGLISATSAMRVPHQPEAGMLPRLYMPVRSGNATVGHLWVIDPEENLNETEIPDIISLANMAAAVIVSRTDTAAADRDRQRELLTQLCKGPDTTVTEQLADLGGVSTDVLIGVDRESAGFGRWELGDGLVVHLNPGPGHHCLSGAAVPLVQLSVAADRARQAERAIAAGARPKVVAWDALGSWLLLTGASLELSPEALHPCVTVLAEEQHGELRRSVRLFLELGGDVASAADKLFIHRTTLYYRLERVEKLCGIDLSHTRVREDLLAALRLQEIRALP